MEPLTDSAWNDLLCDIQTPEQWAAHRKVLHARYLELIRDAAKPERVPLDLKIEKEWQVESLYRLQLISYQVEVDERAYAWLGIPSGLSASVPGVVALHETRPQGGRETSGMEGPSDKAFLDHLVRRGFVVIAPEHFVSGHRIPAEGAYETAAFYARHPEWTAVGKFTFEHRIAVDILSTLPEVDPQRLGVMGHSLGGHGAYFLAAYDERIRAAVCNCGAHTFRLNPGIESWARDHWYVYFKHLREDILNGKLPPIDMHEIIALIAPRAFMDVFAWNDGPVATQYQRIFMSQKLCALYSLLGHPENYAFFVHGKGHSVPKESQDLIYRFLAEHLEE